MGRYPTTIKIGKFDKCAGLFAGGGSFDIPENYPLGINVQVTPAVSVAADYGRVHYIGEPAIGNPMSNLMAGNSMGSANGPSFGGSDVNVLKLGVQWQATSTLLLLAGYNQSINPVKAKT